MSNRECNLNPNHQQLFPLIDGVPYGDLSTKLYIINNELAWMHRPRKEDSIVVYSSDGIDIDFQIFLKEFFYKKDRDKLKIQEIMLGCISLHDNENINIRTFINAVDLRYTEYKTPPAKGYLLDDGSRLPPSPYVIRNSNKTFRFIDVIPKGYNGIPVLPEYFQDAEVMHEVIPITTLIAHNPGCSKRFPELVHWDKNCNVPVKQKYIDRFMHQYEKDKKYDTMYFDKEKEKWVNGE